MNKPICKENYVKSENDWEENEIFFTDRQYRRDRSMRGRYKSAAYTPWGGPNTNRTFSSRPSSRQSQQTEKCFVRRKMSCWSTNHTQQERDDSKKKFGDCYP